MLITKPKTDEHPQYCQYFFNLVKDDLMQELENSKISTLEFIKSVPEEKVNFAYAEGKWTVKEVLRHIIECERIFAYRALRFSRFDEAQLPGFDENRYILNSKNIEISLKNIAEEYELVRNSTIKLFQPMNVEMLDFKGIANDTVYTPRSLGYMAVGHNLHHIEFLKKKYF